MNFIQWFGVLMIVVGLCLILWPRVRWMYAEFKDGLAIGKLIEDGKVPVDYDVLKREQERINKLDVNALDLMHNKKPNEIRGAVQRCRTKVARIRDAGFVIGQQHQQVKVVFDVGVRQGPFKRGSGEAKQWVRGYCMGRNVIDIKQYYRDA